MALVRSTSRISAYQIIDIRFSAVSISYAKGDQPKIAHIGTVSSSGVLARVHYAFSSSNSYVSQFDLATAHSCRGF